MRSFSMKASSRPRPLMNRKSARFSRMASFDDGWKSWTQTTFLAKLSSGANDTTTRTPFAGHGFSAGLQPDRTAGARAVRVKRNRVNRRLVIGHLGNGILCNTVAILAWTWSGGKRLGERCVG